MIREIKINEILKKYILRRHAQNRLLDSDSMDYLRYRGELRDPFVPLSGNYRLSPTEKIDLEKLNSELDMLDIDRITITKTIKELMESIRSYYLYNEVLRRYCEYKANEIQKSASYIIADQFIDGFTTIIDHKQDFTLESYTNLNIGDIISLRSENDQLITRRRLTDNDVKITIDKILGLPSNSKYSPSIKGDRSGIFNDEPNEPLIIEAMSYMVEPVTVKIKAEINIQNCNNITIIPNTTKRGQYVRVEVTGNSGKSEEIYSTLNSGEIIRIPITRSEIIRTITIYITKTIPDSSIGGVNIYRFALSKVKLSQTTNQSRGEILTKPIQLRNDTRYITLVADEVIPEGSSIRYEVANRIDQNGNPIGFTQVAPTNRENQNIRSNYITTGQMLSFDITYNTKNQDLTRWRNITPERKFGGRLYPIFDIRSIVADDFNIENIVDDGIKLYRGINDWQIIREPIIKESVYKAIPLYPEWNSTTRKYNNLKLPIPVIIPASIPAESTFRIPGTINPHANISILDQNLRRLGMNVLTVAHVSHEGEPHTDILVDKPISTNTSQNYYVSYNRNSEEITEYTIAIQTNTKLYNRRTTYERYKDYEIIVGEDNDCQIYFPQGSSYDGSDLFMDLYVTEKYNKERIIHRTYLDVKAAIVVDIVPFTQQEVSAGNYHKIDGVDVSFLNSYSLSPGRYVIESTQIFPMINTITEESSAAAIYFPEANCSYMAFDMSMRKIPVYDLVLNSFEDDRQFAIEDGIVYLNRIPEEPETLEESVTGKYIRTVGKTSRDSELIAKPETFRIHIAYNGTQENNVVFLRINLERDINNPASTPEIRRLGINQFNGEIGDIP